MNTQRFFVDTFVTDVQVNDALTIAVMEEAANSPCPSNEFIFSRDRPKWLYQTGRLLQAMREPAAIRVSASCVDGLQSINAIQFLPQPQRAAADDGTAGAIATPLTDGVAMDNPRVAATPGDDGAGRIVPAPATPSPDRVPVPTPSDNADAELPTGNGPGVSIVPLPSQP